MSDVVLWLGAGAAGLLSGLVFFVGLWLTLQRLPTAQAPALLLLGSLVLRFGLVLAVLFAATRMGGWQAVLAAAAGFTLARLFTLRKFMVADAGTAGERA